MAAPMSVSMPALWLSYARASTDEQTSSCAQQHAENERASGAAPAAVFSDENVQGATPLDKRPAFSRLLAHLRRSPPGTFAVRAYDTSRLGRFLDPEFHFVAEWFLRQAGAREIVYTKGAYTPGRSMANSVLKVVEAHANRAYSEKLSRDVHRGLIAAVRSGARSGGFAPFGYDLEYRDHEGRPYARVRFVPVGGPRVKGGHRAFEKHVTYLDGGRGEVLGPEHRFVPKTRPIRSRLVVGDPERVAIVHEIFERYLAGVGMQRIARDLTARGALSPEGNGWSVPSVRVILTNPTYAGATVYGRRSESKYHALEAGGSVRELAPAEHAGKYSWRLEDRARWVVAEETHPALVSWETWTRVNERREAAGVEIHAAAGRAKARHPYLLSGLLFCPSCGARYVGARTKSGKGYVTGYYACGTRARGGECEWGRVSEPRADGAVIGYVGGIFRVSVRIGELREALAEELRAWIARDGDTPPLDPRAAELEKVERDLAAIVEHVRPENLALFDARITKLRERREVLGAALAAVPPVVAPAPPIDFDAELAAALERARTVRKLLEVRDDPESVLQLREEILPQLARRIDAYPKGEGGGYLELEPAGLGDGAALMGPGAGRTGEGAVGRGRVWDTESRGERIFTVSQTSGRVRLRLAS